MSLSSKHRSKPARVLFFLVSLFFFFATFESWQPALAQEQENVESDRPLLMPTSAWLVGPASLVSATDEEDGRACVMMNQFDNGFLLRFSASGGLIHAMAVDIRQPAFDPGGNYDVGMQIGEHLPYQTLSGTAHNAATLLINTQDIEGFYAAIENGNSMTMKIGGREIEFVMIGADDGLRRAEECYGQKKASAVDTRPVATARPLYNKKSTTLSPGDALPAVSGIEPAAGLASEKKSDEAKVSATTHRLAQSWLAPLFENSQVSHMQKYDVMLSSPAESAQGQWRVIKGSNLRSVLDVWTKLENVELVWASEDDFTIRESMNFQGTFEEAVSRLLDQYKASETRPFGKVYNQSVKDGRKVLLIESDG